MNLLTFMVGIGYPYDNSTENTLTICSREMISFRTKHLIVCLATSSSVTYENITFIFLLKI